MEKSKVFRKNLKLKERKLHKIQKIKKIRIHFGFGYIFIIIKKSQLLNEKENVLYKNKKFNSGLIKRKGFTFNRKDF